MLPPLQYDPSLGNPHFGHDSGRRWYRLRRAAHQAMPKAYTPGERFSFLRV